MNTAGRGHDRPCDRAVCLPFFAAAHATDWWPRTLCADPSGERPGAADHRPHRSRSRCRSRPPGRRRPGAPRAPPSFPARDRRGRRRHPCAVQLGRVELPGAARCRRGAARPGRPGGDRGEGRGGRRPAHDAWRRDEHRRQRHRDRAGGGPLAAPLGRPGAGSGGRDRDRAAGHGPRRPQPGRGRPRPARRAGPVHPQPLHRRRDARQQRLRVALGPLGHHGREHPGAGGHHPGRVAAADGGARPGARCRASPA